MPCRVSASLLVVAVLVLAASLCSHADEKPSPATLDPDLAYQARKSNPVTYDVDFSVVVTAPYHTKRLKIWLPLPPSDAAQEVAESTLSTFPADVKPRIGTEPVYGNRFAYFEFDHPEGGQVIRHRFKIKAWQLDWDVDSKKVVATRTWPSGFDRYLKSDRAVVVDERFTALAKQIVPEKHGAAEDLAAVMDWLQAHMKYDHSNASLMASSEHALTKKAGHCSDYHGLCAAFGRALGYPTRVTYGINSFPKNSPSHCKIEAYLPPYGWVSFDVSETQKLLAEIRKDPSLKEEERQELVRLATARLRRGFRDNTWYLQTRGTDYDLAPPAARRVNVVRTIYAEADGVALPEPDPADASRREFAWMTVHRFMPDRSVSYPFKTWQILRQGERQATK